MILPIRELAAYIKACVLRWRGSRPSCGLYYHDLDDATQDILIHVVDKWPQHKGDKWKAWVCIIVHNQMMNRVRDRVVEYKRMPMLRMISRVTQDDETGHEEIVYEPDMPAPEDGVDKTRAALVELTGEHRQLVDAFMRFGQWDRARKSLHWHQGRAFRIRTEMAAQVKAAI